MVGILPACYTVTQSSGMHCKIRKSLQLLDVETHLLVNLRWVLVQRLMYAEKIIAVQAPRYYVDCRIYLASPCLEDRDGICNVTIDRLSECQGTYVVGKSY